MMDIYTIAYVMLCVFIVWRKFQYKKVALWFSSIAIKQQMKVLDLYLNYLCSIF